MCGTSSTHLLAEKIDIYYIYITYIIYIINRSLDVTSTFGYPAAAQIAASPTTAPSAAAAATCATCGTGEVQ